jgi:hypothetical protein
MKKSALLLIPLLLLIACSEQLTPEEQKYKEFCSEVEGMWMKMSPIEDGKVTGEPCYGCMPDEANHYCTQEEYEAKT